ncbi:hypothetical protein KSD_82710 [Ktedonobacter sp. SOSP1-85]|nr:hypothetical protein KSD_82710 [Ktedonobacter sp. SOSP1-85]
MMDDTIQLRKYWRRGATGITFKLKDELHHPQFCWPRTLLSYPLIFEPEGIRADQLHLIDQETGKEVPFQLTEQQTNGIDLVSARLHFFSDLPSGATRCFRLQRERGKEEQQETRDKMRAEVEGETIVLYAGALQVRIPASQTVSAQIAPGPIIQMKREHGWIGNGTVQGGRLGICSLETRQIEIGPLFVTYQIRYHFVGGATYTATVRAILNYDFVELSEQMQDLEQQAGASMQIAWDKFSPTHRFSSTWPGSQQASDYVAPEGEPELYQWRAIDDPIVVGYNGEDPAFFGRSRVEQPEEDFAFTVGPYAPSYAWNIRSHATFWDRKNAESLGVFIRNPDRWDDQAYALWASADILQIHFRYKQGKLHWTCPLANGTRQIGIAFYNHAKDLHVLKEQDRQAQELAERYDIPLSQALTNTRYLTTYTRHLHHWYSTLNLDLVKDWILTYSGTRPKVFFQEGQINSARQLWQKLFTGSEGPRLIAQGINELAGYLNIGQRPIYDYFLDGYNRHSAQLTTQQQAEVDALFLLTAYISAREEIVLLLRMLGGHPNFMADGKAVLPCFAWLYPDHTLAGEWRDIFETFLTLVGTFHTRPELPALQARGGRWTESLAVYLWAFLRPVVSGNFLGLMTDERNRCAQPFLGL